jgi:hypothetical protein
MYAGWCRLAFDLLLGAGRSTTGLTSSSVVLRRVMVSAVMPPPPGDYSSSGFVLDGSPDSSRR